MATLRRPRKPRLAVWKFASCDGCQLSLLDCEDELLAIADAVDIAYFPEASRAMGKGPFDLSLVEGSITTPHDAERIHGIRRASRTLVTIGACATAGGLQALRNHADVKDWVPLVYASPEVIETLRTSTPIANHVRVDYELHGCPVSKEQLVEVVKAFAAGRRPVLPAHPVCIECKRRGLACVLVARGVPCLGPVTRTGCGALCPTWGRGCFGCFGPVRGAHAVGLAGVFKANGLGDDGVVRAFRGIYAGAEAFRKASELHE
uniref:Oxidoreductase n=1 Tax=Eiseniibacteriota bacterium TaxID=2212470 RepID=A0A832MM05_UNCEI